ncbi:hypothetical protein MAR_026177, partial [Mya arenaria]
STSAPEHNDRDDTQREDTSWDVVEGTDEDGELSRLDTRIEDYLSGSICDDNDESMQAPDEYMSTDDCRCKTTCMSLFHSDGIQEHILSVREMEKSEKELYVMGSLQKFAHEKTKGGKRKRIRYRYVDDGRIVARRERKVYRETLKEAADEVSSHVRAIGPVPVLSCPELVHGHYTFDYSQNVTIPHHSRQMGPLYFITGRKAHIFGRVCQHKKLFRRCDVDSLAQLAEVVDKSSKSNVPVLYKKTDGSENWIQTNCRLDWKSYLQLNFLPVRGIQKYHSCRFCKADFSAVYVKRTSGEPEARVQLMKRAAVLPQGMPNTVKPAGLIAERRRYLRMHVRQYVRPACSDSTCPEE